MKGYTFYEKNIICGIAAALCACAASVPAYAADILTDRSVYLDNSESAIPVKDWVINGKTYIAVPDGIMPAYEASICDYAETGSFEITPLVKFHFTDATDEYGYFAGQMIMDLEDGILTPGQLTPTDSNRGLEPISFEANKKRINALMKKHGLNTDFKEVKLLDLDGAGFVYYIDNGSERILAAANISDVNARFFNDKNGGLIVIDSDEFKAAAAVGLEERNKYLEEQRIKYESWDPEIPRPAGNIYVIPTFKADNKPYQNSTDNLLASGGNKDTPNTGGEQSPETERRLTVLKVELSALAALAVGIAVISRKRKHDDHE